MTFSQYAIARVAAQIAARVNDPKMRRSGSMVTMSAADHDTAEAVFPIVLASREDADKGLIRRAAQTMGKMKQCPETEIWFLDRERL